jgi:tetratricopeptide (TPR) repeat protein
MALAATAHGRELATTDGERARFMLKEGTVRERNGDYSEALARSEEALTLADEALLPEVEVAYGGVLFRQAQYEEAIEWCKRAAEHAQAAGKRETVAHAYFVLDAANTHLGRLEPEWTEQALAIYDELGDALGASKVLNNLGIHAYYAGRWDESLDYYRRSRAAKQRAGDVVAAAILLNNEGEILADQGHYTEAQELFDDALRICRAAHYALGEAFVKANLARLAARTVRFAEAHELFDEARAQLEDIGSHGLALEVDARRAECLVFEGRHREAAELAAAALERSEGLGRRGTLGPLLERLVGYALHQDRQPVEARPHFEESLRLAREAGADYDVALTLRALADTGGGDRKEADEIFTRLGIVAAPSIPLP